MKSHGKIQNKERLCQIPVFEELAFRIKNEPYRGTQSPTDIDLYFEYQNNLAIIGEFKIEGNRMPNGQRITMTRMVDALSHVYNGVYLIIATHSTPITEPFYDASKTVVRQMYFEGKWRPLNKEKTFKEVWDMLLVKHNIIKEAP